MVTQEQIQEITNIIVDSVHPQKVYLFGSYAKGNATETSDIDFLIVMPDRTKKKYQVVEEIEKKIRNTLAVSKDVVVDYADKYSRFHSVPYSFIGHIVSTGILLYES
jgi:predicted nucleotidyltransferase